MVEKAAFHPAISKHVSEDVRKIRDVSEKLEANFIAEMLKHADYGESPEGFGGGIGEEQFGSFLRMAQADAMVKAGGIGLAETIFGTLVKSLEEGK